MKKLLLLLLITASMLNAYDITVNNTTDYPVRMYIGVQGTDSCVQPNHGPNILSPHTKDQWPTHISKFSPYYFMDCINYINFYFPIYAYSGSKLYLKGYESKPEVWPTDLTHNNFEIYVEKDAHGIPHLHVRQV